MHARVNAETHYYLPAEPAAWPAYRPSPSQPLAVAPHGRVS